MPRLNGTGPWGNGAGTGRGLGPCCGGAAYGRFGRGGRFRGYCQAPVISKEEEAEMLSEEESMLEEELKNIKERLAGLKEKK